LISNRWNSLEASDKGQGRARKIAKKTTIDLAGDGGNSGTKMPAIRLLRRHLRVEEHQAIRFEDFPPFKTFADADGFWHSHTRRARMNSTLQIPNSSCTIVTLTSCTRTTICWL